MMINVSNFKDILCLVFFLKKCWEWTKRPATTWTPKKTQNLSSIFLKKEKKLETGQLQTT